MSTSALWSWRSEGGRSLAFSAEDAATLEQDYLLHVFWGDDPEQKTETGWSKLPGDRVIDFARMRQLRPDAVGMFDSVMRSANTVGPTAVVSEGRYQAAELQIRTEGPAAPLFSPQPLVAACITGNAHDVRMLLLQFTEFANAIVDEKSQASGTCEAVSQLIRALAELLMCVSQFFTLRHPPGTLQSFAASRLVVQALKRARRLARPQFTRQHRLAPRASSNSSHRLEPTWRLKLLTVLCLCTLLLSMATRPSCAI